MSQPVPPPGSPEPQPGAPAPATPTTGGPLPPGPGDPAAAAGHPPAPAGHPSAPAGHPPAAAGYPPAPAGYPPPMGYPGASGQPPAKRGGSKALKIVLISLAAVLVLCVGGIAVAFVAFKDDISETVAATEIRLTEPATLGGRPKVTEPELQTVADEMSAGMKADLPGATSTVGAFYGDPAAEDLVMIAGASALIMQPERQLDDAINGLGTGGLTVTNVTSVDPGPLGGSAKCGDADAGGVAMGVCLWADRGSLGIIGMYFKSAEQARAEFVAIRGEVEQQS